MQLENPSKGFEKITFTPEEKSYLLLSDEEKKSFNTVEELIEQNFERLKKGTLDLRWMNPPKENWGYRAKPSARGLTWTDINKNPHYGTFPEVATTKGFTPRGAFTDPEEASLYPSMGYDVLNAHDVWADNVITLYEEAKSRQWNATSDVPWNDLKPISDDLEKATCQLATLLTQVEFIAGDFPSRWMWRIPNDFFEVKSFLSTQIVDEARHAEVFRKRALAGGGLLKGAYGPEWALKTILDAPNHTFGTYILNVLGEGFVLTLFRAGEFLSMTDTDKEIFRRCMQDEARHVSYGVMQLKYYLDHHPNRAQAEEDLHKYASFAERIILGVLMDACVIEPFLILFGGGVNKIEEGFEGFRGFWAMVVEEYLQRTDRAGFSRRDRCSLPMEFPL